jgi:hypothetical protein
MTPRLASFYGFDLAGTRSQPTHDLDGPASKNGFEDTRSDAMPDNSKTNPAGKSL